MRPSAQRGAAVFRASRTFPPAIRDRVGIAVLRTVASVAIGLTGLILIYIVLGSLPALRRLGLLRFFSDARWNPLAGEFDLVPMLVGTGVVATGAVLLASPLAIASALFGRFYAPRFAARAHRIVLETLAGIPSVLFGLWGLVVLVPALARFGTPGHSILAGILVLALMVLPTIALVSDSALAAVPEAQLRAGAATGLSRWAVVRAIALPQARPGILIGMLLGAGRALGETIAVVMVMGNVAAMPAGLWAPARTLTANIALEMAYATEAHRSVLFVSGLALACVTLLLILIVDRIGARHERPPEICDV